MDENAINIGRIDGQSSDLFINYVIGLEAAWERVPRSLKEANAEQAKKVDDLLAECRVGASSWALQWRKANLLEQCMVPFLSREQICAEATRRFVDAEKLGLTSRAALLEKWDAIKDKKEETDQLKAIYTSLLDALQWFYGKRRLDRSARFRAVMPTLWLGIVLVALAFAPLVLRVLPWNILQNGSALDRPAVIGVYTAITFGLLGALFSRLSSLQANFATLDYDAAINVFKLRVILARLLFGIIGSVVLYYAIVSQLLAGQLFPDKLGELKLDLLTAPDAAYAKLVVWSFIGGFSERLIPEFLTRTEAGVSKKA